MEVVANFFNYTSADFLTVSLMEEIRTTVTLKREFVNRDWVVALAILVIVGLSFLSMHGEEWMIFTSKRLQKE